MGSRARWASAAMVATMGAYASPSPATVFIDDGYTYFAANIRNMPDRTYQWIPDPQLRVVGAARGDPLRLVLKHDGRVVYAHTCPLAGPKGNQTQACHSRDSSIAETGVFDVEIHLSSGGTETLLRTLRLEVRQTEKQGGRRPEFFVVRHTEAAVGFLSTDLKNSLYLNTVFSPDADYGKSFGYTPELRCTVAGSAVAIPDPRVGFKQVAQRSVSVFSERFDAKRAIQRDTLRFDQMKIQLPLSVGKAHTPNWTDVTRHPGPWACDIVGDKSKTVFRTLRFEVGNGAIVPHPEQRSANVRFDADHWLVDLQIPDGGSDIDKRLLPAPTAGLFYGIPWTTPEGRAMAARMPAKGDPLPVGAR